MAMDSDHFDRVLQKIIEYALDFVDGLPEDTTNKELSEMVKGTFGLHEFRGTIFRSEEDEDRMLAKIGVTRAEYKEFKEEFAKRRRKNRLPKQLPPPTGSPEEN